MLRPTLAVLGAATALACIPADTTPGLGSVAFHLASNSVDDESVRWGRILLGYKTMTIGDKNSPDLCSYRGRGALSNVVFGPRVGVTQTFNGIGPVICPDVGIILGAPDGATLVGPGASSADLIELATPPAAQAIIEATLTAGGRSARLALRFDTRASTRFGGCGATSPASGTSALPPGVTIVANQRRDEEVRFAPEVIFRVGISPSSPSSVLPFLLADAQNDADGIVTMADLDNYELASAAADVNVGGDPSDYELINGSRDGSFGDYIRTLFRFSMIFGAGICLGLDPNAPP